MCIKKTGKHGVGERERGDIVGRRFGDVEDLEAGRCDVREAEGGTSVSDGGGGTVQCGGVFLTELLLVLFFFTLVTRPSRIDWNCEMVGWLHAWWNYGGKKGGGDVTC